VPDLPALVCSPSTRRWSATRLQRRRLPAWASPSGLPALAPARSPGRAGAPVTPAPACGGWRPARGRGLPSLVGRSARRSGAGSLS